MGLGGRGRNGKSWGRREREREVESTEAGRKKNDTETS